jgi:hypothetical protein
MTGTLRSRPHDLLRAFVVLLSAGFMVWINVVLAARQVPVSTAERGGPIDPATYAFAIWGVIFTLVLGFGVYALLPTNPGRALVRRTGYPAAAAFLVTGLWPIAVANRQLDLAQVLIVLMWALLAVVYLRAASTPGMTSAERWLAGLTFGMFFGWVTAANAVSLQSRVHAWTDSPGAAAIAGIAGLLLAGGVAAWFVLRGNEGPRQLWLTYAGTMLWAAVAIVVRQAGSDWTGVVVAVIATIPVVAAVAANRNAVSSADPAIA